MITAGLYKICTQILIRSINKAGAVSDKLGHSCKSGPSWWWIPPEEESRQLLLRREGRLARERRRWEEQTAASAASGADFPQLGSRTLTSLVWLPPSTRFVLVQIQHGTSYREVGTERGGGRMFRESLIG